MGFWDPEDEWGFWEFPALSKQGSADFGNSEPFPGRDQWDFGNSEPFAGKDQRGFGMQGMSGVWGIPSPFQGSLGFWEFPALSRVGPAGFWEFWYLSNPGTPFQQLRRSRRRLTRKDKARITASWEWDGNPRKNPWKRGLGMVESPWKPHKSMEKGFGNDGTPWEHHKSIEKGSGKDFGGILEFLSHRESKSWKSGNSRII